MTDNTHKRDEQDNVSDLLAFAHALADEASRRLLAWFGKASSGVKRDGTVVTQADLDVDQFIHEAINARYPAHGIVSEEISQVYAGKEHTWVIDPLDGTTNFANGLSHWGSSIAVLWKGSPRLAVLDFPLLNQRFHAVCGQGAWYNGQPLRVAPPTEDHRHHFITIDSRAYRHLDVNVQPKARILGSAAFELSAVAAGVAVGCVEITPKIWDIAGAWLINQEAGAMIGPLLTGVSIFPLQAALDYSDQVFPTLAATDQQLWTTLRAGIRIKPGAERLIRRLKAQGWVLDPAPGLE